MLRTTNPRHSLWEAILPDACLGLPAELARVDTLLDDPRFLAPLTAHFDPHLGRPSIPLDTLKGAQTRTWPLTCWFAPDPGSVA